MSKCLCTYYSERVAFYLVFATLIKVNGHINSSTRRRTHLFSTWKMPTENAILMLWTRMSQTLLLKRYIDTRWRWFQCQSKVTLFWWCRICVGGKESFWVPCHWQRCETCLEWDFSSLVHCFTTVYDLKWNVWATKFLIKRKLQNLIHQISKTSFLRGETWKLFLNTVNATQLIVTAVHFKSTSPNKTSPLNLFDPRED